MGPELQLEEAHPQAPSACPGLRLEENTGECPDASYLPVPAEKFHVKIAMEYCWGSRPKRQRSPQYSTENPVLRVGTDNEVKSQQKSPHPKHKVSLEEFKTCYAMRATMAMVKPKPSLAPD